MIARYTMTAKLNIVRDKISECNGALTVQHEIRRNLKVTVPELHDIEPLLERYAMTAKFMLLVDAVNDLAEYVWALGYQVVQLDPIIDRYAETKKLNMLVDKVNEIVAIVNEVGDIRIEEIDWTSVAHVENAVPNEKPRKIRVIGKTRQNLWSNPVGAANGATISSLEDGSISLSGDVTERTPISINTFVLKPSTTYTISCDKVMSDLSDSGFYVQYKQGGQLTGFKSTGNATSATFETPSDLDGATCGVILQPGYSQGTYRVMLNEGSAAEPWCPPGLTSVGELGVVTAGRNLLQYLDNLATSSVNGITFTPQSDFGIRVQGTATADAYYNIDYMSSYKSAISDARPFAGREVTASKTGGEGVNFGSGVFTGPDNSWENMVSVSGTTTAAVPDYALAFRSILSVSQGTTVDTVIYPQLELGSTATAYEPPAVTTTPIDLDGRELRSLPDGTCDVLVWNETGAVSVEQVSIELVYDGDEDWKDYQQSGQRPGLFGVTIKGVTTYPQVPFCDSYAVYSSGGGSVGTYPDMTAGIDQNYNVWIRDTRFTTLEDFKANLASNPVTFVALAASSSSIDLPSATMPALPESTASVWAVCDPPTKVSMECYVYGGGE